MGGSPSSQKATSERYKAHRPDPIHTGRRGSGTAVESPLSIGSFSPTTPGSGEKMSIKDSLKERRRATVEMLAERKAAQRQLESPSPVSKHDMKKMSNKDKLLEVIRIRHPTLVQATTFSVTVQWEMQHKEGESRVQKFELQWALLTSNAAPSKEMHAWSSLEASPDLRVSVVCSSAWSTLPRSVVNEEKRVVYIGGLEPNCPPMTFRVRARNLSGWGNWCDPSAPITTLNPTLPPPRCLELTAFSCRLGWAPKKDWKHYGQVIYYKVFGRRIPAPDDGPMPLGFFSSLEFQELYTGRNTNFEVGKHGTKPLAPNASYGFQLECRTGLSRGDKRYMSMFHSTERTIRTPVAVPTQPALPTVAWRRSTTLRLSWNAPASDGGSMVVGYTLLGCTRNGGSERFTEFYRGPDLACTVGEPNAARGVCDGPLAEGTEYGFKLVAMNDEGPSAASKLVWVRTLTAVEEEQEQQELAELELLRQRHASWDGNAEHADDGSMSEEKHGSELLQPSPNGIVDLPEGWSEYWDPATGECFYYNSVTGENQWELPSGAKASTTGNSEKESGVANKSLDFRKKRFRFLHAMQQLSRANSLEDTLSIRIRRNHLVADSFASLRRLSGEQLRKRLRVVFEGEPGIDSGGLSKDWFLELSRQLLLPEYCLFTRGSSGLYNIDPRSSVLPEAPHYFRVFGRLLGKALLDQFMVEVPLCHGLYKRILGKTPSLGDLAQLDSQLCSSLAWMLQNDISGIIEETFSVTVEEFGSRREVDLIPSGKRIDVTDKNKKRYVDALVSWRFGGGVGHQLKCLLEGLYEIVPPATLETFSAAELEILLNGFPGVDVAALRSGYIKLSGGFMAESKTVELFWEAMEEFNDDERGQVLRFCTGCGKMPPVWPTPKPTFTFRENHKANAPHAVSFAYCMQA